MINPLIVKKLIEDAFIEDNHYVDITSDTLLKKELVATGKMVAKEEGIICGVEIAKQCFYILNPEIDVDIKMADGQRAVVGDVIMTVSGCARDIIKAERIALNFIQRMSGIATQTNRYVEALNNPAIKIVDTRKTTPNFRVFEKYSVLIGGGFNHRYNTSDMMMIKDNHIAIYGGIRPAVEYARTKLGHSVKIEVEVSNLEQMREAVEIGADIIMLDNMSTYAMREAIHINSGKSILEVSGNVTLERLPKLAKLDVDVISVGALTHSYQSLDISLKTIIK